MEINKEFARKCGEALVYEYNVKYENLSGYCRKVYFKSLYEDLNNLGCKDLIATAKGDKEVRKYGLGL